MKYTHLVAAIVATFIMSSCTTALMVERGQDGRLYAARVPVMDPAFKRAVGVGIAGATQGAIEGAILGNRGPGAGRLALARGGSTAATALLFGGGSSMGYPTAGYGRPVQMGLPYGFGYGNPYSCGSYRGYPPTYSRGGGGQVILHNVQGGSRPVTGPMRW